MSASWNVEIFHHEDVSSSELSCDLQLKGNQNFVRTEAKARRCHFFTTIRRFKCIHK